MSTMQLLHDSAIHLYTIGLFSVIFKILIEYFLLVFRIPPFSCEKQAIYGYIKARFLLKLNTIQIHRTLTNGYRIRRLLNGQESLKDDFDVECTITSIVQ